MQDTSYLGVYSIGLPNAKGQMQKKMHFVWAEDSGTFCVQLLDGAFQPVGTKKSIGPVEFKKKYTHEPSVMAVPVNTGTKPWLHTPLLRASTPVQPSESVSEVARALASLHEQEIPEGSSPAKQTENYLRGFFGKALKRIKFPQERTAAINSLKTVAEVEEGIVPEHKFMFADFGVALRKNDLLELALACGKRVLALAPEDDHAHFNIARILFEMSQLEDAEQHLLTAQSMNPAETIYGKMLDYIQHERRRRLRPQKMSAASRKTTTGSQTRRKY